jgi:restriction endonuclease
MWARKKAVHASRVDREQRAAQREAQKETAEERTAEAREANKTVEGLLISTLAARHAIDWQSLKDFKPFDPDPIRGGKIVIQAKRYTNTVGVSAVRDLYGTVLNEGATKGILVTTADYGPDAYEFAKGKPLTLLSGSNLLQLLEKHGHKAKIDLREAKRILAEREREDTSS